MSAKKILTIAAVSKPHDERRTVGGKKAESIYGPGGLRSRIRRRHRDDDLVTVIEAAPPSGGEPIPSREEYESNRMNHGPSREELSDLQCAMEHNTKDSGRPPFGGDEARRYRLASEPMSDIRDEVAEYFLSMREFEEQTIDIKPRGAAYEVRACNRCGRPADSDGRVEVDGVAAECHCECHAGGECSDRSKVLYRGRRNRPHELTSIFDQKTRYLLKIDIFRGDKGLPLRGDLIDLGEVRNWGPSAHKRSTKRLALDICADVLGDDEAALEVYELFEEVFISRIPGDEWSISRVRLKRDLEKLVQRRRDQ